MRGKKVKALKSEVFPNPGRKFGGFYKPKKKPKEKKIEVPIIGSGPQGLL